MVLAVQTDLSAIVSLLETALGRARTLEAATGMVTGLSSILKAKAGEWERALEVLRAEHAAVPKKLQGSPEPVSQYVDEAKLAQVRAATEGA